MTSFRGLCIPVFVWLSAVRLQEASDTHRRLGFDQKLMKQACLPHLLDWGFATEDEICNPANEYKDDRGNYIKYTQKEDAISMKIWQHVMRDCESGQSYLRDIVSAFAEGTSCKFKEVDGQPLQNKDGLYLLEQRDEWKVDSLKISDDGSKLVPDVRNGAVKQKVRICEGSEDFGPRELSASQAAMKGLVWQYDQLIAGQNLTSNDAGDLKSVCHKMHAAHYLKEFRVRNVLENIRPYACREAQDDNKLCTDLEAWYMKFMSRSLFATHSVRLEKENHTVTGKKGRAAKSENRRSAYCLEEAGVKHLEPSTNIGITVEKKPTCTIAESLDQNILPEGSPKPNFLISANMIADHYRDCAVPFLAGVSGSIPQYLMIVGGGKEKVGKEFETALSDKELLTVISMLELAGFHSIGELIMAVNHYYASARMTEQNGAAYHGRVRPPFDSGDLLQEGFATELRCHDQECCGQGAQMSQEELLADDSPYMRFHARFEAWVNEAFNVTTKEAEKDAGRTIGLPVSSGSHHSHDNMLCLVLLSIVASLRLV